MEINASIEIEHHISQEVINSFADVSGDHNPVHVDKEYAKEQWSRVLRKRPQ